MTDPITRTQLVNAATDSGLIETLLEGSNGVPVVTRGGRSLKNWATIQANAESSIGAYAPNLWVRPVLSFKTASQLAALSPSDGDRYLLSDGSYVNQVAEWKAADSAWQYSGDPLTDQELKVGSAPYVFHGGSWQPYRFIDASVDLAPCYVELFNSLFFGRGMLAAEDPSAFDTVVSDQAVVSDGAKGSDTVTIEDNSKAVAGAVWSGLHSDGTYGTYLVPQIGVSNAITIWPPARADLVRMARGWVNRAHGGRYVQRQLAQRIARSSEIDCALPSKDRFLFSNFSDTSAENTLIAVGGASSLGYYDGTAYDSDAALAKAARFTNQKTAYAEITNAGDGVKTPPFSARNGGDAILRFAFSSSSSTAQFHAYIYDEGGNILLDFTIPTGNGMLLTQIYSAPFNLRNAKTVYAEIVETGSNVACHIHIGWIDVFQAPKSLGPIIKRRDAIIAIIDHSWGAGLDISTYPERESYAVQLQAELPLATILNHSEGGDSVATLLSRAPAVLDGIISDYGRVDYVIWSGVENSLYSPASSVFDPNTLDTLMSDINAMHNLIASYGARSIHIGVAALAEVDEEFTTITAGSYSGGTYTVTLDYDYGIVVGDAFVIKGSTGSALDGSHTATSGTSGTTLKFALASDPGTLASYGSITWVLNDRTRLANREFMARSTARPRCESGSFTPTLTTDATDFDSVSYHTLNSGKWWRTRVSDGWITFFSCRVVTTAITAGSATGNVCVGGLPSTPDNLSVHSVTVGKASDFTGQTPIKAGIEAGKTKINLYYRDTSYGADTYSAVSDVTTGSAGNDISLSGWYHSTSP